MLLGRILGTSRFQEGGVVLDLADGTPNPVG
jgi:hypothetical protein